MRTVMIPFLNWPVPVLALELAIVSAVALALALIVVAVRAWRELAADERAWRADPDAASWDGDAPAAALATLVRLHREDRWHQDLAEIRADERAIDEWRDAGYPPGRVPYAITGAAARYRSRLQLVA